MQNNLIIRILCSAPVILAALYFLPVLGICLIILRYIASNRDRDRLPYLLMGLGVALWIPKLAALVCRWIQVDTKTIPYLSDLNGSEIYGTSLINYSEVLLITGAVFLIMSILFKKMLQKLKEMFMQYIHSEQQKNYEIDQKNNLKIKEKQLRAKTTHIVYCPHCGASNILTEKTGICEYCHSKIE